MKIKDIMTRSFARIPPEASLADAVLRLEESNGEPIAVCEGKRVIGVLTEHDIIHWTGQGGSDPRRTKVRQVMEFDAPVCFEDEDLEKVAEEVYKKHVHSAIVLRKDHGTEEPVGVLSSGALSFRSAKPDLAGAPQPRTFLEPIAAPSVLGLFAFAGATLITGAYMAGWYGSVLSPLYLFPFAAMLGVAQFLAGMWAFKARDTLAAAMHGIWGSFWMAYGVIEALIATRTVAVPRGIFPELGFWFIILGAITWMGALAAAAENLVMCAHLIALAGAASISAYAFLAGNQVAARIAGWVFVVSAGLAWYLASGMMVERTFRRPILPLTTYPHGANQPGDEATARIYLAPDGTGVRQGQ